MEDGADGAVFFQEDDAGGLQGGAERVQGAGARSAGAALEMHDRCLAAPPPNARFGASRKSVV